MFTIHNLEFGAHLIGKAMAYTNKATTVRLLLNGSFRNIFSLLRNFINHVFFYYQVSPTYSREVCENPAIGPHFDKFHGILNGIDPDIWNPFNDKFLPVSMHIHNFPFFMHKLL